MPAARETALADEPLTGGCLCGAVRFEVDPPLGDAGWCHCRRCQRRTGTAASAGVRVRPGTLRWVADEERIRTWWPPGGFGKAFCPDCGAHLASRSPEDPEVVTLRLGAFDADPGVRPAFHQWVESAPAWAPVPDDGLPRFARGRPR